MSRSGSVFSEYSALKYNLWILTLTPAGPMGPRGPAGPGEPCRHTENQSETGSEGRLGLR